MNTDLLFYLLPFFLYAEMHYKFKYFFSLLRKHEPEILADIPYRIDVNSPLPIFIMIKDAHLFPTILEQITVEIKSTNSFLIKKELLEAPIKIAVKYWWQIFYIPLNSFNGMLECNVSFQINHNGKTKIYHNDNYRTTTHAPFKVFVSPNPLPRFDDLVFGECHLHSLYTEDQVEFGPPLEVCAKIGRAIGLSFFCVTDHSYDLDDKIDNFMINDPHIPKWHLLQNEIEHLNANSKGFTIIRGEEVSCRNFYNKNIHLLLLGNKKFYTGSGDSAERWLNTKSELSLIDILSDIDKNIACFAAHPQEHVFILERILLNRGTWTDSDLKHSRLTGVEFLNGKLSKGFWKGYKQWINLLTQGIHLSILAGNDAHGSFGRCRQIQIPFLKIRDKYFHLFGKYKTGVFSKSINEEGILQSIKNGKIIITDGPVANFKVNNQIDVTTSIGQCYVGQNHKIFFDVQSAEEFGTIKSIKIFKGIIGKGEKIFYLEKSVKLFKFNKEFHFECQSDSYIRAEVWTSEDDSQDGISHFCFTNPIWFSR